MDKFEWILKAFLVVALGFLAVAGVRLGEYVFERPPMRLLICVSDEDALLGNCKPFDKYLTEALEVNESNEGI